MFGTLTRPLPKKQVSRLLYVDLAVILVLLIFPVRSAWSDYRSAKAALEEQESYADRWELDILTARRAERDRPVMIGEIRAAADQLARSNRSLRSPGDVAAILEEVRDLARRMNLENISINPRDPVPQDGFQYHEMTVSVTGTFSEHLRFINALRNQASLYIYSSLTLRVETADARRPQLRMELGLRSVLVEDLMPLAEINRLVNELAIGIPPDTTVVSSGDGGSGGSDGRDGDR
jgi:hypothetical protein